MNGVRIAPAVLLLAAVSLGACGADDAAPNEDGSTTTSTNGTSATAPATTGDRYADRPIRWVDVAEAGGIAVQNNSGKPAEKDWIVSGMGGGTIALDYDSDGDMDICIVDGTMLTKEGALVWNDDHRTRLFRNDGEMKFTDVTREAGVDIQAFGFGGASCDYDADGHPDLYVCTWGRNFLLRNQGDGTFEDVTDAAGVRGDDEDMSTACAWGDVNGDGIHDLYVSNYIDQWGFIRYCAEGGAEGGDPIEGRHCRWRNLPVYCGPPGLDGQLDRLYFGNGDGTFREVSETSLPDQRARYAFQCIMTDVDNDGDLDVFVANDTQSNHLWLNDGSGVFREVGVQAGVATNADAKEQAGMGVDAADVNQDGKLDLIVTHFSDDYNTLYVNDTRRPGVPVFRDATHTYGLADLAFKRLCWGTRLFDMDLDGDLDMFVACGHVYGEIDMFAELTGSTYAQRNLLLRNTGGTRFKFEDVTDQSGPAFQIERVWRGACFGDFDDDGDMDVFATSLNGLSALYRNDGGNENAFLRFRLVGKGTQRDPSGARVIVHHASGAKVMEELHHGASFCGDNDPRLLFGLGGADTAPKVEVVWPDGSQQTFEDVPTRRMFVIEQGVDELRPDGPSTGE